MKLGCMRKKHCLIDKQSVPSEKCADYLLIEKAKVFNKANDCLDEFWLGHVLRLRTDTDPIKMVSLILVLSHGHASVQRGFNIIKEFIVENQMDQSLIAMRFVHDHVNKLGVPLVDSVIPKSLINSDRTARSRYQNGSLPYCYEVCS